VIALLAAVTVGLMTGRVVGIWMSRRRVAVGKAPPPPRLTPSVATDERLRGLLCGLGDVVVLAHGEEAWLAGALLFRERVAHQDEAGDGARTAAALFVGPDRGAPRAVYARPVPAPSLDWMWPLTEGAPEMGNEPPSSVEHEGERFERVRRLPLAVIGVGSGAPDVGGEAVIGEYEGSAGARLLVVMSATSTCVWRGRRLEQGMYDVLPGDASAEP
jgi:hypothetical protein